MARDVVRSILVASDLSGSADAVVRAAAELAAQTGATLHAIHAIEVLGRPFWEATFDLRRLQKVIHDARNGLHEQLRRVVPSGVEVGSAQLDYQAAHAAILRRAKEVEADLLVVGPHRVRVPGSHVLGTTAQRVVEEAAVPCLVTRGPLAFPLRSVLLPVGELDVERGLLATGAEWLAGLRWQQERRGEEGHATELRVLHVIRAASEWRDLSPQLSRELRTIAARTEVDAPVRLRRTVAWSRTPAAEIVRISDEAPVDLIGMGMRGHGPLMRALLGSVSSGVLRHASVPVLLFPPRMCERWGKDPGALHPRPGLVAWGEALPAHAVPARDADGEWHHLYLSSDPDEDELEPTSASIAR